MTAILNLRKSHSTGLLALSRHPKAIFITGLPASGKTTFAKRLAMEFNLPVISKDEIKELLFDSLGSKDRAWSQQLGACAFILLYQMLEKLLSSQSSFIVDCDFSQPDLDGKRLGKILGRYSHQAIEIRLVCAGEILIERFRSRSEGGLRHPGHVDHENYAEFEPSLALGRRESLVLGGLCLDLDMTSFNSVQESEIVNKIKKSIQAFD